MTITDDRIALQGLVQAYAINADRRDQAGFAACFFDDATLTTFNGNEPLHRFDGIDEISVITTSLGRYDKTLHHVTTHWSEIHGITATGTTYCSAHHITITDGAAVDRVLDIHYADLYGRSFDGWRIRDREVHIEWISEHDVTL